MYALPTIQIKSGQLTFREGTLFKLPMELQTRPQLQYYQWQCKEGWNTCPQGFHVYVRWDDAGNRIIVPGLIIRGRKNSTKRFHDRRFEFTEEQVVDFTESLVNEARIVEEKKNAELSLLIHDLRGFSSAIYNAAEEAKTSLDAEERATTLKRIESVIATQILLSIRIDLLDFAANQIALDAIDSIPVYRKVDKVVRCFRPKARAKGVSIQIEGHSTKRTIGPAIFELIIYSIIENAIKYSPSGMSIKVVLRDLPREISVNVISTGPKISRSERTKIFEKGYRARQAELTSQVGTGLGLHSAKVLLEDHFGGSITVHQDGEAQLMNGLPYLRTEFEIVVPEERRARH